MLLKLFRRNYTRACVYEMFSVITFLPHSAPSWILSQAEILASSNLQDGATKWYYYQPGNDKPLLLLL